MAGRLASDGMAAILSGATDSADFATSDAGIPADPRPGRGSGVLARVEGWDEPGGPRIQATYSSESVGALWAADVRNGTVTAVGPDSLDSLIVQHPALASPPSLVLTDAVSNPRDVSVDAAGWIHMVGLARSGPRPPALLDPWQPEFGSDDDDDAYHLIASSAGDLLLLSHRRGHARRGGGGGHRRRGLRLRARAR